MTAETPNLRPAPSATPSQTEVVIRGIKAMITGGELKPGSRLPIEKDLAALLSVSRGSLREGVRALAVMGILDTRQGAGTYVTSLRPDLMLSPLTFLADVQDEAGAVDLQSVRRILETEAAGLAARQITDDELAAAAAVLAEAETLINTDGETDHESILDTDVRFHQIIAVASRNRALEALIEATSSRTVRARLWRAITESGVERVTHTEHQAILAAVRSGDTEAARIRMANHLLGVEAFVQNQASMTDS
ncbi:FadR family transcriptional regulator [Microbacteriaceae bacterium VKM Ac-2854]|nr:FadR family transcriptional regulator [Microbacteriaceae bacterium VKM Ac-2854]